MSDTLPPPRRLLLPIVLACLTNVPALAQGVPRIGVRLVGGIGELYDTTSGHRFVPRGVNYVRLGSQTDAWPPASTFTYHNVFRVGEYDPQTVRAALGRMRADGYNTVRVFLNPYCSDGCIGDFANGGLRTVYLENVTDFLRVASENGLHVILTQDQSPRTEPYSSQSLAQCCSKFEGINLQVLSPGGLTANRSFWNDFMAGMQALGAPLEAVLAYELRNELSFESTQKPLSLASGLVTTANGMTYDMSDPAQKEAMMDENLVHWVDALRARIRLYDPDALVTCGFFVPQSPHPARVADTRVIRTGPVFASSTLDFVDLHAYPGIDLTLAQYVDNFEMAAYPEKPVLLGEFGAYKPIYTTALDGALALGAWVAESCSYGFDGWLTWTWNTYEQPEYWSSLGANEIVNRVLAPQARVDPCVPPPVANLALGSTLVASGQVSGYEPERAADGILNTWWSAGGFAPQWIEIDLGSPQEIGRVRLHVSQTPDGNTVHRVLLRGPTAGDPWNQLVEFNGFTTGTQVLEHTPAMPVSLVRWVRVETDSSPSWVGWREIEVVAAEFVGSSPSSPALASPAPGAIVRTHAPTLSWSQVPEALTYHLQVARDAGFADIVFQSGTIPGTSLFLPGLGENATFHWRVRSGNWNGVSPWSPTSGFTAKVPTRRLIPPGTVPGIRTR